MMAIVRAGDFLRKDGALVKVLDVAEVCGDTVLFTSDGGCIGNNEVRIDDVLLESEAYDEFYNGVSV